MFSLRRCNRSSAYAALCNLGLIIDWSLKRLVIKYTSSCRGPVSQSGAGGSDNLYMSLCDSRVCARTTSLQGNYLVKTLGPVTACLPLIKDSSHVWSSPVIHMIINKQQRSWISIHQEGSRDYSLQPFLQTWNHPILKSQSACPILSWNRTHFITMRIKNSQWN